MHSFKLLNLLFQSIGFYLNSLYIALVLFNQSNSHGEK